MDLTSCIFIAVCVLKLKFVFTKYWSKRVNLYFLFAINRWRFLGRNRIGTKELAQLLLLIRLISASKLTLRQWFPLRFVVHIWLVCGCCAGSQDSVPCCGSIQQSELCQCINKQLCSGWNRGSWMSPI